MNPERRSSARELLALPITLADGTPAVTRDISADGLYFLMPAGHAIDPWIALEYEMPAARLKFCAAGEVLRLEALPHATGVALRLHAPRLVALD